jgi:hypothetical protein
VHDLLMEFQPLEQQVDQGVQLLVQLLPSVLCHKTEVVFLQPLQLVGVQAQLPEQDVLLFLLLFPFC